jgi:hypothetical protein
MATERELYEDWKPIFEAEQDRQVTEDVDLARLAMLPEQTNYEPGIPAGWPENNKELEIPVHSPGVQRFIDSVGGDDDC